MYIKIFRCLCLTLTLLQKNLRKFGKVDFSKQAELWALGLRACRFSSSTFNRLSKPLTDGRAQPKIGSRHKPNHIVYMTYYQISLEFNVNNVKNNFKPNLRIFFKSLYIVSRKRFLKAIYQGNEFQKWVQIIFDRPLG